MLVINNKKISVEELLNNNVEFKKPMKPVNKSLESVNKLSEQQPINKSVNKLSEQQPINKSVNKLSEQPINKQVNKLSEQINNLDLHNNLNLLTKFGGYDPNNKSGYLSTNLDYQNYVNKAIEYEYNIDNLSNDYKKFLYKLRDEYNFRPKVCYDIGSCVLHWTRHAELIWKNTKVILFEAFEPFKMFYSSYDYYMGVLSNTDNKEIKFYQNDNCFGGNSYYREVGCPINFFDENIYLNKITRTLDSVVKEKGYPYPDLIKMDIQGAELDVLKGSPNVLNNTSVILFEAQHINYNDKAPLYQELDTFMQNNGWKLLCKFTFTSDADSDYCYYNLNKINLTK
jgi:FkbM family methyltransferase